jgi:ribosomal protein S25
MTDFLDEQRKQIADRLKELEPLVDEHNRLEAAASALAKLGAPAPAAAAAAATTTLAATPRRRPGRPRGSINRASKAAPAASAAATPAATPVKAAPKKAASRKARRGRRKGSGTRAAQALSVVQGQPGITIPELATKMGIQATYLYRVLPGLEQEGKVEKKGRGWFPREGS